MTDPPKILFFVNIQKQRNYRQTGVLINLCSLDKVLEVREYRACTGSNNTASNVTSKITKGLNKEKDKWSRKVIDLKLSLW